jgi:hypothetical protein
MNNGLSLIIEAKSRKHSANPLTKNQQGQLLVAGEWFKKEYPNDPFIPVVIHPNLGATDQTIPAECRVLTLDMLNSMIAESRAMFRALCDSIASKTALQMQCENALRSSNLQPEALVKKFLAQFRPASK